MGGAGPSNMGVLFHRAWHQVLSEKLHCAQGVCLSPGHDRGGRRRRRARADHRWWGWAGACCWRRRTGIGRRAGSRRWGAGISRRWAAEGRGKSAHMGGMGARLQWPQLPQGAAAGREGRCRRGAWRPELWRLGRLAGPCTPRWQRRRACRAAASAPRDPHVQVALWGHPPVPLGGCWGCTREQEPAQQGRGGPGAGSAPPTHAQLHSVMVGSWKRMCVWLVCDRNQRTRFSLCGLLRMLGTQGPRAVPAELQQPWRLAGWACRASGSVYRAATPTRGL